jgi:hypothetical protein
VKPKVIVVIRPSVAVRIRVLTVVVIAVGQNWTVELIKYAVRRVFLRIKPSVTRTVSGHSATTTTTVLAERNVVEMENVSPLSSAMRNVTRTQNAIRANIVAR